MGLGRCRGTGHCSRWAELFSRSLEPELSAKSSMDAHSMKQSSFLKYILPIYVRGEEFFERKSGATGHGHGKSSVWTVTVSWTVWVSEFDFDFEEENMSVC